MLIALIGQDGAGKSTQSLMLQDWLNSIGKSVCVLDKWDVLDAAQHNECRFMSGDRHQLRVCISEMEGHARALFLMWTMHITMQKKMQANPDTVFISDGYWVKHAASEIVYGIDSAWVENLVSVFPKPDLTFYFEIDPLLAANRKDEFTPYECGRDTGLSLESFLVHQKKVQLVLDGWKKLHDWKIVDASIDKMDVQNLLKKEICNYLQEAF